MNPVEELQSWYREQCNGVWEHTHGVSIDTLDNPGWSVKIDLEGTPLADRDFTEVKSAYDDEHHWMVCTKMGLTFEAACGPGRLSDALRVFVTWARGAT